MLFSCAGDDLWHSSPHRAKRIPLVLHCIQLDSKCSCCHMHTCPFWGICRTTGQITRQPSHPIASVLVRQTFAITPKSLPNNRGSYQICSCSALTARPTKRRLHNVCAHTKPDRTHVPHIPCNRSAWLPFEAMITMPPSRM